MTTIHIEQEATFEGPGVLDPDALVRLPGVAGVRSEPPEELDALYYDTPDLRLLAHGSTLSRRSGGPDEGWHAKLPGGGTDGGDGSGADGLRQEIQAPLRAETAGQVPDELDRHLRAYTRGADLVPVVHLRTHRRRHLLLDDRDRCLAEIAQDRVAAQVLDADRLHTDVDGGTEIFGYTAPVAGRQRSAALRRSGRYPGDGTAAELVHWSEIDVERGQGDIPLMQAAARLLEEGGWHSSRSGRKIDHALADDLPPEFGNRRQGRRPRVGSAGEAVVERIGDQLEVLLACDPGARADEPDAVHQMRSTCRRLRSLLRGSRGLFDRTRDDKAVGVDRVDGRVGRGGVDEVDEVVAGLRWLTGALAGSRDHEVLCARFRQQALDLGGADGEVLAHRIAEQEARRHDAAHRAAVTALDSPRYHRLLDALEHLREEPPLRWSAADKPAVRHLRKVARRDRRRLAGRMADAEATEPGPARDAALHRARKAARRARYTGETALPYGGGKAARLRKRAKGVQQVLGEHQDAVMAREVLPNLAAEAHANGADTYGYGRLHARQDELARQAREALPAVWEKFADRKPMRF